MTTFLALYRGQTIGEAKIISVSNDAALVAYVASQLLRESVERSSSASADTVCNVLESGRREALALITKGGDEHQ